MFSLINKHFKGIIYVNNEVFFNVILIRGEFSKAKEVENNKKS